VTEARAVKSATDIPDWVDCEVADVDYNPVPTRETVRCLYRSLGWR
jgi:hypothetical protein